MQFEVWVGFDDFIGKTDAECAEIMCSEIVTKDHSLWNYQRVFDIYGSQIAEGFFQRFKSDGKEAASLQYKDPGVDFSNDEFQVSLMGWSTDFLIGETADAIRLLSLQSIPQWKLLGFPSAPTEADVAMARSARGCRLEIEQFHNEVWSTMLSGNATKSQLKSAVAEW